MGATSHRAESFLDLNLVCAHHQPGTSSGPQRRVRVKAEPSGTADAAAARPR
jgi:hypothetical protein